MRRDPPTESTSNARVLVRVTLFFAASMLVLALCGALPQFVPRVSPEVVVGVVATLATLLLTAAFLRWDGLRFVDLGLAPDGRTPLRFAMGVLVGLALVAAHMGLLSVVGRVRWLPVESVDPGRVALAVAGYALLASREEVAFRGYPLRRLASGFGPWAAQILVVMVFIAEHRLGGATWSNAIIGSGLGGLVFGMAALATRGLALPIGLHAAWNVGDWARGGKGVDGVWRAVVDPAHQRAMDSLSMVLYATIMAAAFGVFGWMYVRSRRIARDTLPDLPVGGR